MASKLEILSDAAHKPPTPPINEAGIPAELKVIPRWVVWAWISLNGKWAKPPLDSRTLLPGDASDPANHLSFDDAIAIYRAGKADGIGIALGDTIFGTLAGVDLDDCFDEQGALKSHAAAAVATLNSYTEISPSTTGLKILSFSDLPPGAKHTNKDLGMEVYDGGRYFTITGNHWAGTPTNVAGRQEELIALVAQYFTPPPRKSDKPTSLTPPTDDQRAKDNALEAMLRHKPKPGENDGSGRLVLISRCAKEHNLSDEATLDTIKRYMEVYPFPNRDYDDDAILDRVRSAAERTEPGSAKTLRKADDIGNGQRFADQHSENVRYSFDWKKWLYWDGGRWLLDNMGGVKRLAKKTARSIYGELEHIDSAEIRDAMIKHAKGSASRDRQSAMLEMAQSELPIPVDYRTLDAHPYLLNCKNGTVDLRTGKLKSHCREDYLTKQCPLIYPATYTPPKLWLAFLDRIFAGNANLIAFIQRLMGYSLVGEVTEHILPIFHGGGSNGKTVLTGTWLGMLGDEYATSTSKEFLMQSKSERHATELASLYGQRLVISAETDEGARLNEARVKHLTGGNPIQARRMREDFWEFKPSHTLILETNHRPYIVGTDFAIWRRVLLVPFEVTIPDGEQDKELAKKLKAEWPTILRWAVEGCLKWQGFGGLQPPSEVQNASSEYREASDSFGEFLNECCTIAPTKTARAGTIYARYVNWIRARGGQPQSHRRIGERLAAMYTKGKDKHGAVYHGIGVVADVDDAFTDVTTGDSQ